MKGTAGVYRVSVSRFVRFGQHLPETQAISPRGKANAADEKQSERDRAGHAELADQYRAIGPAALVAAPLHTKKRKTVSIVSKAA